MGVGGEGPSTARAGESRVYTAIHAAERKWTRALRAEEAVEQVVVTWAAAESLFHNTVR